jgi:hypothetical protein
MPFGSTFDVGGRSRAAQPVSTMRTGSSIQPASRMRQTLTSLVPEPDTGWGPAEAAHDRSLAQVWHVLRSHAGQAQADSRSSLCCRAWTLKRKLRLPMQRTPKLQNSGVRVLLARRALRVCLMLRFRTRKHDRLSGLMLLGMGSHLTHQRPSECRLIFS